MRKIGIGIVITVVAIIGMLGLTQTQNTVGRLPEYVRPLNYPTNLPVDANGNLCISVSLINPQTGDEIDIGTMRTSGIDFRGASEEDKYALYSAMHDSIMRRHNASVSAGLTLGDPAFAQPTCTVDCQGGGGCCGKWCNGKFVSQGPMLPCRKTCQDRECLAVQECCGAGCSTWCSEPCCPVSP